MVRRLIRLLVPCPTYAIQFRNLALSLAAGNATIWKPSPTTPLCAIAVTKIVSTVLERNGIPGAVASLVTGGKDTGKAIVESHDVELGKGPKSSSTFEFRSLCFQQFPLLEANTLVAALGRPWPPGLVK